MKIAVVGSGIAGLGALWRLRRRLGASECRLALYERAGWIGGHTHTVDVTLEGVTHGVDTGFLVFNRHTYPNLVALFEHLNVPVAETDMSFSVCVPSDGRMLEWAGRNLDTVFAQRRNAFSRRFLWMLREILRFNREATAIATEVEGRGETLGEFLARRRFSDTLRDWYLLPMAGAIWSCPTATMLGFPMRTFARFCHNHALLQVEGRPKWYTVRGGAREYVRRLLDDTPDVSIRGGAARIIRHPHGVQVVRDDGTADEFDHVIVATHTDQTLKLLDDPTRAERAVLSAIAYQPNRAVLHTDASVLPRARRAWSAWNYVSRPGIDGGASVAVNYLINELQPLPFRQSVVVSLNPVQPIDPARTIAEFDYDHPVLDQAAVDAQVRLPAVQGLRRTWFAGAWAGYGFHEDGLRAGYAAADAVVAAVSVGPSRIALRAA